MTGDVREECLFFLDGSGKNGKGTFLGAVAKAMGDYAVASDMGTFTVGGYDRHPTDLAKLAGSRLVTALEPEHGRTWAWSRLKELTGNERPISARFMRRDFFEYFVTFKLAFAGNYKPHLPTVDVATERRPIVIPFRFTVPEADKNLKSALIPAHQVILRWGIDGCLDWRANGLVRPACVVQATRDYLDQQNLLAQWIEAECTIGPSESDSHDSLYAAWSKFASANGEVAGSGRDFHERMIKAGFKAIKHTPLRHNLRGYAGISRKRV